MSACLVAVLAFGVPMRELTRFLGLACLVCLALPILADVARQLLPLVATLFICAVLFAALTSRKK